MPRLFVAVDLPDSAISELIRIQPRPAAGIRPTNRDQIHVTLNFLGEVDISQISAALQNVSVPAFALTFEGVGMFPSAGGGAIGWAGLRDCPPLFNLHAAVSSALSPHGFQPEARPYTPHVTLVRYKPFAAEGITEFLTEHENFQLPDQAITTFGLYSSSPVNGGYLHHCEASFPLIG